MKDIPQNKSPKEIGKSIINQLNSPIIEALHSEGITSSYLAKLLRKELKAKQVKVFSDKGTIIYSDKLDALDIQQKARQDAHKLRGDYPAEEHRITGEVGPIGVDREDLLIISKKIYEEVRKKKREG